jgi:hypothetical protein
MCAETAGGANLLLGAFVGRRGEVAVVGHAMRRRFRTYVAPSDRVDSTAQGRDGWIWPLWHIRNGGRDDVRVPISDGTRMFLYFSRTHMVPNHQSMSID